jgi:cellulose synthase/poly-beta-1,6-N-acetylglucosamine synthase-like glycosyltransferase
MLYSLILKNQKENYSTNIKFAILAPAHNEERVISCFIESALNVDYPKDKFDIFLVLDHCTDKTMEIANKYKINILEYKDKNLPAGKARALNWATEIILKNDYQAICYFDADSLVHPNFLKAMSASVESGAMAIQGHQIPKNPRSSWLSRIISVGQMISNRFFQKPKSHLGFSATLHGKGICLKRNIVEKFKWDEQCLTEDLEMQMRLIANSIHIHWNEFAIVYDEQPETFRQYFKRTIRWTRGSLDTAKKHLWELLKNFIKTKDRRILEAFFYCANVYRLSIIGITALIIWMHFDKFNFLIWLYDIIPGSEIALKILFLSPIMIMPLIILVYEKEEADMLLAYFLQPALGFLRIATFVLGIFKDNIHWNRTEHTSAIEISELIK